MQVNTPFRKVRHFGYRASFSCIWHQVKPTSQSWKQGSIANVTYFSEPCIESLASHSGQKYLNTTSLDDIRRLHQFSIPSLLPYPVIYVPINFNILLTSPPGAYPRHLTPCSIPPVGNLTCWTAVRVGHLTLSHKTWSIWSFNQGLKFIYFLSILMGYQDSKFSIPPENPVSQFWILVTGTISIIPRPIQISFHNSHCYKLQ